MWLKVHKPILKQESPSELWEYAIYMFLYLILAFSIPLPLPTMATASQKTGEPEWFNCSNYKLMSENVAPLKCDETADEYLLSFGQKFCLRFVSAGIIVDNEIGFLARSLFDNQKQKNSNDDQNLFHESPQYRRWLWVFHESVKYRRWLWGTMACLQQEMAHFISQSQNLSCANIKKFGFNSHKKCFLENNFCDVTPFWTHIAMDIVGIQNSLPFLADSLSIVRSCSLK